MSDKEKLEPWSEADTQAALFIVPFFFAGLVIGGLLAWAVL